MGLFREREGGGGAGGEERGEGVKGSSSRAESCGQGARDLGAWALIEAGVSLVVTHGQCVCALL